MTEGCFRMRGRGKWRGAALFVAVLALCSASGPALAEVDPHSKPPTLEDLLRSIQALELDSQKMGEWATQIEEWVEYERIDREIRRIEIDLDRLKEAKTSLAQKLPAPPPPTTTGLSTENFEFFETHIRPVLVENCLECHGPETRKAGLRLDRSEEFLRGGDSGPVVFPGDPAGSPLIKVLRYQDPSLQMPPTGKLPESTLQKFEEWVQRGAPYPPAQGEVTPADQPNPLDLAEAREFWSFKPLANPTPPEVREAEWVRSPIDRFVLAELEQRGLPHAPEADKRTLIRRVTFDLTGLPPTPEEVTNFLSDDSPEAFARVVNRLLDSPHYGERWGRHWLDVVRYTDSFDSRASFEQDVGESYRYRDWVVSALNEDMPYDRFLQYQIAGDLLPPRGDEKASFNPEGIVATGMLAIGNWPGGDADKEKMVTDIVDDQIDVISRAMLGLTVACARCHDHKFDPIGTEDYYGLAGIFFSSHILPGPGEKTEGSPVLRIPLVSPHELEARRAVEARIAGLESEIASIESKAKRAEAIESLARVPEYLIAARSFRQAIESGVTVSRKEVVDTVGLEAEPFEAWLRFLGYEKNQPLAKPVANIHGKTGLHAWVGSQDTSSLTVNTNESELTYLTIIHPARTAAVHPSPQNAVAVSWRAPESGGFSVTGRVEDLDSTCGDGIAWSLSLEQSGSARTLCQGNFINGGEEFFSNAAGADSLASLAMDEGDLLILTISPKSSHACDTTRVDLRIASLTGSDRVWDLAEDLAKDVLEGNPHSDRYGNEAVWGFVESTEKGGKAAGEKILEAWSREVGRISFELGAPETLEAAVRQAADRLTQQLVAFSAMDATAQAAAEHASLGPILQDLVSDQGPFATRFEPHLLEAGKKERWMALKDELAALLSNPQPPLEYANGIQEGGVPNTEYSGFQDVRVHIRGRYDRLGDPVPRRFPIVLAVEEVGAIRDGSGRLEMARWVSSASNPLTARVIANRIWHHHFGEGIVRTPGNFGRLGEPPTHPELLDWLARETIGNGWSLKAIHRQILLSSTYRQSSEASPLGFETDPDNHWLSRQNRRRLEAESIRDAMLQVSGRLDRTLGGAPFRDLATPRRTLYFKTVRSDRTSFNMLFDGADPTAIVDKRTAATVAPQALFLLNHPFVLEMADAVAQRVLDDPVIGKAERIAGLYEALYARPPTAVEVDIGLSLLSADSEEASAAWRSYCQVLLCANEFVFVD